MDLYNAGPDSGTAISGIFIKNVLPQSPAGRTNELKVKLKLNLQCVKLLKLLSLLFIQTSNAVNRSLENTLTIYFLETRSCSNDGQKTQLDSQKKCFQLFSTYCSQTE